MMSGDQAKGQDYTRHASVQERDCIKLLPYKFCTTKALALATMARQRSQQIFYRADRILRQLEQSRYNAATGSDADSPKANPTAAGPPQHQSRTYIMVPLCSALLP